MRSIFWGVVLIAIGLVRGDSVFRGDFNVLSIFFDALGLFFIVRGALTMYQQKRREETSTPVPPPSNTP